MSDNIVQTAAEELKRWLEALEKILSKMESDKMAAAKAKLDTERFDKMFNELKGIKEGVNKMPDGPEKQALSQDLDGALDKLNSHGNKTGHGMDKQQDFDGKFKNKTDKKGLGEGQQHEAGKAIKPPPAAKVSVPGR